MKKFFSLICATLLVLSTSAAPAAQKDQLAKKTPVAVEQTQTVQFEKAQVANFNQLSAAPALKVTNPKAQAPAILGKKVTKANHNAAPAVSATPRKAPKAVMEDSIVTAIDWAYDDYYYDVYVYAENTTYLFELAYSTGGLTYGTTYTFADMYADWVCTLDEEGYPLVTATDATLIVTQDSAGLIHIAATMVLSGITHVITYDEAPFVPSGVQIPLNGTELSGSYNSWYYMYVYTAKVGANEIQLAFDATAEQATYTKDLVLTDYCVYYSPDYSTYVEFVKAASNFTVTTTDSTKVLAGSLYATNGDEYILNLVYEKPITERDTVDIISTKMVYHDFLASNQAVQFYAGSDVEGYTQFLVTSKNASTIDGTFDIYVGYSFADSIDGSQIGFEEGQITIVKEDGVYHLTGWVIGDNEKYYRLDWTEIAGVLQYDTDAPFDATFEYADMSTDLDEGVIYISATNAENLTMGLVLFTDSANTEIPAGTYVISDSEEAGTALKSEGVYAGYLTECFAGVRGTSGLTDCWFIVEGTVTLSYDEFNKLKVVVDGTNSYGQPVTALVQYVKLDPKNVVNFTDAEVYVYEGYVEQYGIMNFYGGNADGYEFDLYAYADTIAGDFLEAIDFGDCKLSAPNGASVGVIDAYEFKVERDGKNLTLIAKVLGSDTVQYNITATGYLGYIQGDAIDAYRGEFAIEEIAAQQIAISEVNYIYIQGTNAAGDQLALVVKGELEEDVIAAGEYTEVMACPGFDAQGQLAPSYVGNNAGVWFIQSGKLTVAENGSMVFEGVNSYDAPVVIIFTLSAIPTIFNVTVPVGTDACYLVGSLNEWNINEPIEMTKVDDTHYTYTAESDLTGAEYKYVHGADWAMVEKAADGSEIGNRVVNAEVMNDTVEKWADVTGLFDVEVNATATKFLHNGQLIIRKGDKTYNALGEEL